MTDQPRRFPAPWTVEEYRGISYIVRSAQDAYGIAELPDLLGAAQREDANGARPENKQCSVPVHKLGMPPHC
jgi:hypothetical protein